MASVNVQEYENNSRKLTLSVRLKMITKRKTRVTCYYPNKGKYMYKFALSPPMA